MQLWWFTVWNECGFSWPALKYGFSPHRSPGPPLPPKGMSASGQGRTFGWVQSFIYTLTRVNWNHIFARSDQIRWILWHFWGVLLIYELLRSFVSVLEVWKTENGIVLIVVKTKKIAQNRFINCEWRFNGDKSDLTSPFMVPMWLLTSTPGSFLFPARNLEKGN